ncbi:hypothetical protein FQA39_LY15499 [Lamprigera yunnana]|nr:hypothetical protein FQA39_LY15499 [Lamprigera yunnana]
MEETIFLVAVIEQCHVTRTSGWLPPADAWKCGEDALPYGWERGLDDSGRTYYIKEIKMSQAKADYKEINRQAISAIEFLNAFAEHVNSLSSTDKANDLQAQELTFRMEAVKPLKKNTDHIFTN